MKKRIGGVLWMLIGIIATQAQNTHCTKQFGGTSFEEKNVDWDTLSHAYIAFEDANKVLQVSSQFKNVQTLQFIACEANDILAQMGVLPSVNFIAMNRIELNEWPIALNNYNFITCLDLAGNNLKTIPDNIKEFTNLKDLSLGDGAYGGNPIAALSPSIYELKNLEELCLFQVPITEISPEIAKLQNLNYLNLNQTNISEIPKEIGQLSKLKDLQLSSVQITKLPTELVNCMALEEIGLNNCENLDFNQALDVLTQIPNLKNLNVSLNKVSGLANKIAQLEQLETLVITNTDLNYDEVKLILDRCKNLQEVEAIIDGLTANQKEKLGKDYPHILFRFKWF
jgi:Leucine-rich repeat (LRR) protein